MVIIILCGEWRHLQSRCRLKDEHMGGVLRTKVYGNVEVEEPT